MLGHWMDGIGARPEEASRHDRPRPVTQPEPTPPATAIPVFDERGNLPVDDVFTPSALATSVRHTKLIDVRRRLVDDMADSDQRPAIWAGWMRHRQALEQL